MRQVTRVKLATLVLVETKVYKDHQDLRAHKVNAVTLGQVVRKEAAANLELMEMMAKEERQEKQVQQVVRVHLDLLDP